MRFNEIKTRNDFADFLDYPLKRLTYILYRVGTENLYTSFEVPKRSGGVRFINAPSVELKNIQKNLATALDNHNRSIPFKESNISHAFQKNKSIISNAKIHRKKRFIFNIDLENFFDSFHFGRVRGYFLKNKNFRLPLEIATILAQLTCYKGKLPQGAPSSPIITNLICEILDFRLLKLSRKYKLDYTRYADDLTFSTNDRNFLDLQAAFYEELSKEIVSAGFDINEQKNRLQYRDSKQVVTGLVVNKKVNVDNIFYKNTRAMAYQLYKKGTFLIDNKPASINQLEGRFAFINQLSLYNNKIDGHKHTFHNLSSKEKQYQKFLFYKYFFANQNPLIVSEGKTDIAYLKAALKKLYLEYPNLITREVDGTYKFKVSFLERTKRLKYFLKIDQDGADSIKSIYNFYDDKQAAAPNYFSYFKKISNTTPKNPVILLFDNEIESGKKKPIGKFLNHINIDNHKIQLLSDQYNIKITDNLYLTTVPLVSGKSECDIEDLFEETTLSHIIEGKTFSKNNDFNTTKYYGKERFSKYVLLNYSYINFESFRPLLNNLNNIVAGYNKEVGLMSDIHASDSLLKI